MKHELVDIRMDFVLNLLRLHVVKQHGNELNTYCPKCDNKIKGEGHLYINVYKNTFYCHKCGVGGNALQLYAWLNNLDTKEAYREIVQELKGAKRARKAVAEPTATYNVNVVKTENLAPVEQRDLVYREFLNLLDLDDEHREHLLGRGLTDTFTKFKMYKSLNIKDEKSRKEICKKLIEKGLTLEGVPGFFRHSNGDWDFIPYNGFCIPVRDLEGRIQGLQVRIVGDTNGGKYRWFSSGNIPTGTGAKNFVHVVGTFNEERYKRVFIIEGALKADICSYLMDGEMFIGIPGIANSHDQVVEVVKKLGLKYEGEVYVVVDNDYYDKKEVKNSFERIKKKFNDNGISILRLGFNLNYKGFDDYLLAKVRGECV
ncbi:hypothetical protein Calkro_0705 [Caldicellulosiruptor kronotskyensis 2002]|uniref:Zinc finger CHC2-type domain-containing protein n=2 Tax=Caldicellulosiruptor TaxID=44000 RepID=E4SEV9_CALK2|nr:hypothetical protein Calkro_0705 [Caldicellulosiruptor kronotskyensis 2002]